jgi:hypothetical protein
MLNPSYRPLFSYPNDIWLELKVMKLRIMKFSPVSSHFLLRKKYITQHPIIKHPLIFFVSVDGKRSFLPVQSTGQITLQYILNFIFLGMNTEDFF